jgi:hypothetical protein
MSDGATEIPGHWQMEMPTKPGLYFVGRRNGSFDGVRWITIGAGGELQNPGYLSVWYDWWWSEPIQLPPDPPVYP